MSATTATRGRAVAVKAVLWALVGIAAALAVARLFLGLGPVSAMDDETPWGLWKIFNVLAGVGVSAGGFVCAATVHVFHLERYKPFLRGAVLTAFLGYLSVCISLFFDIGQPWEIWRPIFFWQFGSPLFEVAWCVMLYLVVLVGELSPVVLESLRWKQLQAIVKRLTLPIVVTGIALSTLHHSSLGTLFVLTPARMHPLWYTPLLPPTFFASAVGLGLSVIALAHVGSRWLYGEEPSWREVRGLARGAAVAFLVYLAIRLGDLGVRGQLGHALEPGWPTWLFYFELLASAFAPVTIFLVPRFAASRGALVTGLAMAILGFVLHRLDVGWISHVPVLGSRYLPSLSEVLLSAGILSGMGIVFLFFVDHMRIWDEPAAPADHFVRATVEPVSRARFGHPWFGAAQRSALAFTVGAVAGIVLLESSAAARARPAETPVDPPRPVEVVRQRHESAPPTLRLASRDSAPASRQRALLLDGDRHGVYALFDHEGHVGRLEERGGCGACHHRNAPLERGTSCARCHRDMFTETDTFSHEAHERALGGRTSCGTCHGPEDRAKTRATARPCGSCHDRDRAPETLVKAGRSRPEGLAVGYRDALHGLCVDCHVAEEPRLGPEAAGLGRCGTCHGDPRREALVLPEDVRDAPPLAGEARR